VLRRHVIPTAWPWRAWGALRAGRAFELASVRPLDDAEVASAMDTMFEREGGPVRVRRRFASTVARAGGTPSDSQWLWLEQKGSAGTPAALALVKKSPAENRAYVRDVVWHGGPRALKRALLAVAGWTRRNGMAWVDFSVLNLSRAALSAERIGFVPRADEQPIVCRQLGGAPIPPAAEWFFDRLDGSVW
jgi:hypothetical protein